MRCDYQIGAAAPAVCSCWPGGTGAEVGRERVRKRELVSVVAVRRGLTQAQAERVVDCILETMIDALRVGERIEIRGFGAWSIRTTAGHRGKHPKTGAPLEVEGYRWPYFRAGKELRTLVDQGRNGSK